MICVSSGAYPASLQERKVYQILEPVPGDPTAWTRIVDESGEDYLFPSKLFLPIHLPLAVQRLLAASPAR